jgi:hypothetical protein
VVLPRNARQVLVEWGDAGSCEPASETIAQGPAAGKSLGGRVLLFALSLSTSNDIAQSNADGNLWAVSYSARRNLVFDAGFNHGLSGTSTSWEVFVGSPICFRIVFGKLISCLTPDKSCELNRHRLDMHVESAYTTEFLGGLGKCAVRQDADKRGHRQGSRLLWTRKGWSTTRRN